MRLHSDLQSFSSLYSFQGAIVFKVGTLSRPLVAIPFNGITLTANSDYTFFITKENSNLVEIMRFELMTPCLQGRCSPN